MSKSHSDAAGKEKPDALGEEDAGLVDWRYLDRNLSPTPHAGKRDAGLCPAPRNLCKCRASEPGPPWLGECKTWRPSRMAGPFLKRLSTTAEPKCSVGL
jgi:hypothetical protein